MTTEGRSFWPILQFSDSDLADDSPSGDATFAVLVSSFHLEFHGPRPNSSVPTQYRHKGVLHKGVFIIRQADRQTTEFGTGREG